MWMLQRHLAAGRVHRVASGREFGSHLAGEASAAGARGARDSAGSLLQLSSTPSPLFTLFHIVFAPYQAILGHTAYRTVAKHKELRSHLAFLASGGDPADAAAELYGEELCASRVQRF